MKLQIAEKEDLTMGCMRVAQPAPLSAGAHHSCFFCVFPAHPTPPRQYFIPWETVFQM